MTTRYTCPVCGYDRMEDPPKDELGNATYEFCVCCGFQFGVTDDDRGFTYAQWRDRWVAAGMVWWLKEEPAPAAWDPRAQLARLLGGG